MRVRIINLERKLGLDKEKLPITYWMVLVVDKKKSFEEMIDTEGRSVRNSRINVNRGKEYLGSVALNKLPEKIYIRLREIYMNVQEEIKDDYRVGGVFVYMNIKE